MKRLLIISALIACILITGCTSSQTSGKGTLQFSSSPQGAQIYLDKMYQGTTPSTLSGVSAGTHTLEFRDPGYQSWITNITVTTETANYYAALTPVTSQTVQPAQTQAGTVTQPPASTTGSQPTVTIQQSTTVMTIGSTQTFYGTCSGSNTVLLVLYGPGAYTNGVQVAQVAVNGANSWSYTWNPGNRVISGTYSMTAYDAQKISSATATFSVVGGGTISIVPSTSKLSQGGTVTFTGLCTTGATSVSLTLYTPQQSTNGQLSQLIATLPLNADNTWSYKYTFDVTRPTGTYTMVVADAQNTASSSVIITLTGGSN